MVSLTQRKKLVFLITELGYFCSHRLALAIAARQAGYDVSIVSNCNKRHGLSHYEKLLEGFTLYHLPFHRSSLNPFKEIRTLFYIWHLYRQICPDIVHQVALKPLIYGTLCARFQRKVPFIVNSLGGMGYLFTHRNLKTFLMKNVLKFVFRIVLGSKKCPLILQNTDDVTLMTSFVASDKIFLIRGVGINLTEYYPRNEPLYPPVIAVMASRLLWSKGIREVIEAAKILKEQGIDMQIQIAGEPDSQNPKSLSLEDLNNLKKNDNVIFLGEIKNISLLYAQAHLAILPSYREGLPKSLLEAAACGRPIITTYSTGCREVVDDGVNGLLIPVKNGAALAAALKTLAESPEMRHRMGKASRQKAEREFDEEIIIGQTLALYEKGSPS